MFEIPQATEQVRVEWSKHAWLPVVQKPSDYSLGWTKKKWASPKEIRLMTDANLLSASTPLLQLSKPMDLQLLSTFFGWTSKIPLDALLDQLEDASENAENTDDDMLQVLNDHCTTEHIRKLL